MFFLEEGVQLDNICILCPPSTRQDCSHRSPTAACRTYLGGELVGGAVKAHHKRAGHVEIVVVVVVVARRERVVRDVPTEVGREWEREAERVLHLIDGMR